jgi:phage tail-like protein
MTAPGRRCSVADPRPPFSGSFVLTVQGIEIGAFTEVTGLAATIDVEEILEGGQNQFVHKAPKALKWPNVTLKRGITNEDELFSWLRACSGTGLSGNHNSVTRRLVTISVMVTAHPRRPLRAWSLSDAFPVKWTGPRFAASSRDLATEELEVAHHGITVG